MTTEREIPAHGRPRAMPPELTLGGEHALLLQQVVIRAEDVLAVIAEDRWPTAELQALIGYLRAEVLRQAADEEWFLFPTHDAPPGFTRLSRDHVRLRANIDVLARSAADRDTCTPAQLAATTRDLLAQLARHLAAEEALLAAADAPGEVPATATLARRPHEWYPLTEGPVIDLDVLPAGQMAEAAVDRLLRLRHGDQVELRSSTDPSQVWRQVDGLAPGGYGFTYLQDGPHRWRVQVIRRPEITAPDDREGL
jgi:uncharacterized protein (DUF2249 family)